MPLIIIIGRGHSGTRAISQTLVDSGVYMGETLNPSYDLVPAEKMYDACRLMSGYVGHAGDLQWNFDTVLEMAIPDEFKRLVEAYTSSVFKAESAYRGWKLPETTLVLPWIVKMFPDAFYIYWVRDPRDSIIGGHLTDDLADFGVPYDRVDDIREMRAVSWKYQREIVAATPKPKRWFQVRFEDFVLDQRDTLNGLEQFLGMPMAEIVVRSESVGRWKTDTERHDFPMFEDDLQQLSYTSEKG